MEKQQRKRREISIKVGEVYPTCSYGDVLVLNVKSYKEMELFLQSLNKEVV